METPKTPIPDALKPLLERKILQFSQEDEADGWIEFDIEALGDVVDTRYHGEQLRNYTLIIDQRNEEHERATIYSNLIGGDEEEYSGDIESAADWINERIEKCASRDPAR